MEQRRCTADRIAGSDLLEQVPAALCAYQVAADGLIPLAVSDNLCALLGLDRTALMARCAEDPLASLNILDRDRYAADLAALCEEGRRMDGTYRFALAEPEVFAWLRVEGTRMRQEGCDDVLCLCFTDVDAAERKAAERYGDELDHLRQVDEYDLVSKGRFDLTDDTIIEYIPLGEKAPRIGDAGSFTAFGRLLAELIVREDERSTFLGNMDRERLIARYQEGETHLSFQYRREQPGETPLWMSAVLNTFMDPATGHVDCFLYVHDITEKILEKQIISKIAMLGYDVLGLIYPDTGICRYFRIKKDRLGGLYEHTEDYKATIEEDLDRIIAPDQRDHVKASLQLPYIIGKLEEADIYPFPYEMTNREGKLLHKLLQFSYLDDEHDVIFLCKSDITRQHEAEHRQIEQLRAAKLEAEAANQAKSAFLSSMSHDLRTPLNGIIGFTELALRETDPAAKQDHLVKVRSSSSLLLDLVNDTLELSRIESGKYVLEPEAVNSRDLCSAVVTALVPDAELKGLHLEADADSFPGETLWADRLKLQKVILNLLSNAIKYTPAGGTVRLAVERLEPPVGGCNRRIIVSDTGIGIGPEFLPRLFEPFSQEHRPEAGKVMGTGLGLSLVKRTVDMMGGTLTVESTVGVGSTFTVDLPLPYIGEAEAHEAAGGAAEPVFTGAHVLLCEDNELNTEIATILLKDRGIAVDHAADGAEGLEMFRRSEAGTYDAVLMDIRMPKMDGYDTARAIRALRRDDAAGVPIIAMTADAFEEDIRNCLEAGMDAHVTKPIDPARLFETLAAALDGTRDGGTA